MHLDSEAWLPSPYFPQKLYSKQGTVTGDRVKQRIETKEPIDPYRASCGCQTSTIGLYFTGKEKGLGSGIL